MPNGKQTSLWGGFVAEAKTNVPYIALNDQETHELKFAEQEPKPAIGEFGEEMVVKVIEDAQIKQLTITRPFARALAIELEYHKVNLNKLKDHIIYAQRFGKGYTTFYDIDYKGHFPKRPGSRPIKEST